MHSLCRYCDYVILREVAGSTQRLDSATSLRYAQNDMYPLEPKPL